MRLPKGCQDKGRIRCSDTYRPYLQLRPIRGNVNFDLGKSFPSSLGHLGDRDRICAPGGGAGHPVNEAGSPAVEGRLRKWHT